VCPVGGQERVLARVDDTTLPLAVTDGRYFVHDTIGGWLQEVTSEGAIVDLAQISGLGAPGRFAAGGGYFYWTPVVQGHDEIHRVPLDGGPIEIVATLPDDTLGRIRADACNVFWQARTPEYIGELWGRGH
jgi:hypothetical protein